MSQFQSTWTIVKCHNSTVPEPLWNITIPQYLNHCEMSQFHSTWTIVKCHKVIYLVAISCNNGGGNQRVAGSVARTKSESVRVIPSGTNNSLGTLCCLQCQETLCQCVQRTRCRNVPLRATARNQGQEKRQRDLPKIVLLYMNLHICTPAYACTICHYQKTRKQLHLLYILKPFISKHSLYLAYECISVAAPWKQQHQQATGVSLQLCSENVDTSVGKLTNIFDVQRN
jgi:hypothetical protein